MDVAERIERLKLKAQVFLEKNKRAFVKDIYDNWYFCYLQKSTDPSKLKIKNFAGHRFDEGKIFEEIYWVDLDEINDYVDGKK